MSADDNSTDYNSIDIRENDVLVELLSKYRIILERQSTPHINAKKLEARNALTKELNERCKSNLTTKHILKKLNNIKSRLKEKHFKNLSRSKYLAFAEWEQKFLDLWPRNGITDVPKLRSKMDNASEQRLNEFSDNEEELPTLGRPRGVVPAKSAAQRVREYRQRIKENRFCHSNIDTDKPSYTQNQIGDNAIEETIAGDFVIKYEPDDNFYEDDQQTFSETSNYNLDRDIQAQVKLENNENFDDYERMPLENLKQAVLRSQLNTLKAQEAAARAKEKLKLYKLSILKAENE